jgi:hypothetical protein
MDTKMAGENGEKSGRSGTAQNSEAAAQAFLDRFDDALRTLWRDGPTENVTRLRNADAPKND